MGLIDSYNQETVELLLHKGGRETHVWHPDNQLGHLLVLSCAVLRVSHSTK